MAFSELETDVENISKLSDQPNDIDDLTAQELKEKFDKAGSDIKTFINGTLITELEAGTAAASLGAKDEDGDDSTVQAELAKGARAVSSFIMASDSDTETAQKAINEIASKGDAVLVSPDGLPCAFSYKQNSDGNILYFFLPSFAKASTDSYGSASQIVIRSGYLVTVSGTTVQSVVRFSSTTTDVRGFLQTDVDYATPYTPLYNGSPATKKYVDDHHDSTKQDVISDLSTIRSNASTAIGSAVGSINMGFLSATNSLYVQTNKIGGQAMETKSATIPIPSKTSDLTNDSNFSAVSVSATGTATDAVKYITVDGTEKKIGGGTWGSIAGTLTDQTDLTTALGYKYVKPSTGIPETDLATAVVTKLNDTTAKVFELTSLTDLTTGQEILDWLNAGKFPIVKAEVSDSSGSLSGFYLCYSKSSSYVFFERVKGTGIGTNILDQIEIESVAELVFRISGTTLTSMSVYGNTSAAVLDCNTNSSYTPTQDGNPATKKYVDDHHDSTKQDSLPTVTNDRYLHTNATTGALEWVAGSGGGGTWGSITGTLSNQTDLNTALTAKAPTASPVFTGSISMGRKASTTVGTGSVAEGYDASASGDYAHAEGANSAASGNYAHAEGQSSTASGLASHAEGRFAAATGSASHAEGYFVTASGDYSHAEGQSSTASGGKSHAEGEYAEATGSVSHAEGSNSVASGNYSHAEGQAAEASGQTSHAEGFYTIASGASSHVQGKYNVEDSSGTYADIVGGGTADNARKNISALDWNGNLRLKGNVYVGCDDDSTNGTQLETLPTKVNDRYLHTNSSTGALEWSEVQSGGNIFVATYGTTTYSEIEAASLAGKQIFLDVSSAPTGATSAAPPVDVGEMAGFAGFGYEYRQPSVRTNYAHFYGRGFFPKHANVYEVTDANVWSTTITALYSKPSGGIPDSDIASASTWNAKQDALPTKVNDRYLHTNASTGALEWSEVQSGGTWGSITGTLSSQTDLQSALDAKLNIAQGAANVGKIMKVDANGDLALANFYQISANEAGGNTLTL